MLKKSIPIIIISGMILCGCGASSSGDTPIETVKVSTAPAPANSNSVGGALKANSKIPDTAKKSMHLGGN